MKQATVLKQTTMMKQDIIDWLKRNGVMEDDDLVRVEILRDTVYITIVSSLDDVSSYYYTGGKLTIVSGNSVHISNIKIMEDLPL